MGRLHILCDIQELQDTNLHKTTVYEIFDFIFHFLNCLKKVIMIRAVKQANPSGFGLALASFGLNGPG